MQLRVCNNFNRKAVSNLSHVLHDIRDMFTKKSFPLEFRAVEVPTPPEICDAINKYARQRGSVVNFLSTTMPVRFALDNIAYVTKRSRGMFYEPTVRCVEE